MSPVRASQRHRYPPDWPAVSKRIRFGRAGGRCECAGECGTGHRRRCDARHGLAHPVTGSAVVLTTAHLDQQPENCQDANLRAMCQRCHLAYDAVQHAASSALTRRGRVVPAPGLPGWQLRIFRRTAALEHFNDTGAWEPWAEAPVPGRLLVTGQPGCGGGYYELTWHQERYLPSRREIRHALWLMQQPDPALFGRAELALVRALAAACEAAPVVITADRLPADRLPAQPGPLAHASDNAQQERRDR